MQPWATRPGAAVLLCDADLAPAGKPLGTPDRRASDAPDPTRA